jgi:hypothetical protein
MIVHLNIMYILNTNKNLLTCVKFDPKSQIQIHPKTYIGMYWDVLGCVGMCWDA